MRPPVFAFAALLVCVAEASGWDAPWMRHPAAKAEEHLEYRTSVRLGSVPAEARLDVASFGYHELFVNGVKADDRILAPALTRLTRRVNYVAYDVARLLREGENEILVATGPGWARYEYFKEKVRPALSVRGEILAAAALWQCRTTGCRNLGDSKYRDNGGELVDAREEARGEWVEAAECAVPASIAVTPQRCEPTRILAAWPAAKVEKMEDGAWRFDFATNFTGWVELRMNGLAPGDRVELMSADDEATRQDFAQLNVYIARGTNDVFRNRFNYLAGRYLTVAGLKTPPRPQDATALAIGTDLRRTGYFRCDNELFNRIYETDIWTYRMCTTEGYTSDCPHRERLGYGEEMFACAWGIDLPTFDAREYLADYVSKWCDMQEPDGWVHHTTPQENRHAGGPMWSSAGLSVAWEHYLNYGDKSVLETVYPAAEKWLAFLARHAKDGILAPYRQGKLNFLGDWGTAEGKKEFADTPEARFFNNCVWIMNLATMEKIATALGRDEDARRYAADAAALRRRVHARFYDKERHIYPMGLQVPTAFALMTGVVPAELVAEQEAHFDDEITRAHPYLGMGSSGLPVLLKYLTEVRPHDEIVARHLMSLERPSYGYFLAQGETTWPEYWSCDVPSKIHTCYTGISAWFVKRLAGISLDPAAPGGSRIVIAPNVVGGVRRVEAGVETACGKVEVEWRFEDGEFRLKARIPEGASARVVMPGGAVHDLGPGEHLL